MGGARARLCGPCYPPAPTPHVTRRFPLDSGRSGNRSGCPIASVAVSQYVTLITVQSVRSCGGPGLLAPLCVCGSFAPQKRRACSSSGEQSSRHNSSGSSGSSINGQPRDANIPATSMEHSAYIRLAVWWKKKKACHRSSCIPIIMLFFFFFRGYARPPGPKAGSTLASCYFPRDRQNQRLCFMSNSGCFCRSLELFGI